MDSKFARSIPGKQSSVTWFLSILGPGILYAGAAVGVSHLVQATRAGAIYGLGLTSMIILACLIKYPALRFGGEFSAATGKNLVDQYRDTGWWAIIIYAVAQAFSMFFAVAAVSLVTTGLIKATLGFRASDVVVTAAILGVGVLMLLTGRYHLLEKATKVIVAIFTILIFLTFGLVVGRINWAPSNFTLPHFNGPLIAFTIALMGFMPSPMDACVLQSLWTCEKANDRGRMLTPAESRLDFNVGFVISVVLALCFMVLGTAVMHYQGIKPVHNSGGFAAQVISMFTSTIGKWTFPVIGVAAFAVMFSTVLTLLDGYPRIVGAVFSSVFPESGGRVGRFRVYDIAMIILCAGVLLVISVFMRSFTTFIDMTAAIAFITGPILAYLNHHAMLSNTVPVDDRPGLFMRMWSRLGILTMLILAFTFLYYRFLH